MISMKNVLFTTALVAALLSSIIIVRTVGFASKQIAVTPVDDIRVDENGVAVRLGRAVQYKTISHQQNNEFSAEEMLRFHQFLQSSFPRVHASLSREVVGDYSLLYEWRGTNPALRPILLMAHMDVVPVEKESEKLWAHPPFSGAIADGYVWGRGTMDDKVSVLGILEAAEQLLTDGFQPQRTIYFAFGHDEEVGGSGGAARIAALLRSRRTELEYILDEGGNVTEGIVPGIAAPLALIGIAEKGYLSLELIAQGASGHSSMPPRRTAIDILGATIQKLDRTRFPSRLTEPVRQFFQYAGPEMSWLNRLAVANLWIFERAVRWQLEKSPLTVAMIRTSQAPTILQAGTKENVIPAQARAVFNFRILPGESVADVIEHVRVAADDPQITVKELPLQIEPSPISNVDSESYKKLDVTIRQVLPGVKVAPFLLIASTDSRHYMRLSKNIFRFLPIRLRAEDSNRYHGMDERISLKNYAEVVRFFVQLMRNSDERG